MTESEIAICNLALARVGSQSFIDALSESSREAILCSQFYERKRDELLEAVDWPFARRRAALALSGTPPSEWAYAYVFPEHCVAMRSIEDGLRVRRPEDRIPFRIESEAGTERPLIYTDQPNAVAIFTARVTNPARFSRTFADALSWGIASELAMPLAVKADLARLLAGRWEMAVRTAAASAWNQEIPDVPAPSAFEAARE